MKLHRFLIEDVLEQPLGEELLIKEVNLIHQWNNVLKFKKGETIALFDGKSEYDYLYSIKDINNKSSVLSFESKNENISQIKEIGEINLCISLVKKEKMSLIIEKCTEIGVFNFISLVSDRTEKKNIDSFNINKLFKIAKEAMEQSGWGKIPKINKTCKLQELIKNIENEKELEKVGVLHTFDTKNKITSQFKEEELKKLKLKYIFIGPEGGWSDKEIAFFKEKKINFINFGKNILRTETCAINSCFLISVLNKI